MGGRGGKSWISEGEAVSKFTAKIIFNSAKNSNAINSNATVKKDSKLEKIISKGEINYFNEIKTRAEAASIAEYLQDRIGENNRKIAKLGNAEAVFKNQSLAIEHRKLVTANEAMRETMKKFSNAIAPGDISAVYDPKRATTTYNRARKRRIENFNAWFGKR